MFHNERYGSRIHGSADRTAAGAAASAAAVCIHYVFIGGALGAPLNVYDKIHTAAAAAAVAESTAPAAALAAAPAADRWIHIFYYETYFSLPFNISRKHATPHPPP